MFYIIYSMLEDKYIETACVQNIYIITYGMRTSWIFNINTAVVVNNDNTRHCNIIGSISCNIYDTIAHHCHMNEIIIIIIIIIIMIMIIINR
jgi:hypothetical protein